MRFALATAALLLPASAALAGPDCAINREQFDQIAKEMFITQVSTLLGCDGELKEESRSGTVLTSRFAYATSGEGTVTLVFKNRQLVDKSHTGSF